MWVILCYIDRTRVLSVNIIYNFRRSSRYCNAPRPSADPPGKNCTIPQPTIKENETRDGRTTEKEAGSQTHAYFLKGLTAVVNL